MPDIPAYHAAADITFSWGDLDQTSFCQSLKEAYAEIVHWKNLFKVPLENVRKSFVAELSRLYNAFASGSALESIALMAAIVLPILVLQSPHRRSRVKEHIACLERRLKLWKAGDLASLIKEGRTLQQRLPKFFNMQQDEHLARSFANLMFKGKTHAALDLLANNGKVGVLRLDDPSNPSDTNLPSVREVLQSKHPPSLVPRPSPKEERKVWRI